MRQIHRALLSVSDKRGIVDFARTLADRGVRLVSTGGTAKALRDAGLSVTPVSEITGFPEIMDGRVKTLHPRIHGGLLGRRGTDDAVMAKHEIPAIDLVVVNLYPFEATVARPDCSDAEAIENIDIGGPAMIRAAAKNHAFVTVVVDPTDYEGIAAELDANDGALSSQTRRRLATKAYAHTSVYDAAIWNYLQNDQETPEFPAELPVGLRRNTTLRYGENPHQRAALYRLPAGGSGTLLSATQHQGKELSFNNLADADAALECVKAMQCTACVIVKHANPCGVGVADTLAEAYEKAYATDPTSAFGGIIAVNETVDGELAQTIIDRQFLEVIVAPDYDPAALEAFGGKRNIRVLATGALQPTPPGLRLQAINGGVLVQDEDVAPLDTSTLRVVTRREPTPAEMEDALLAWRVVRFVKSNAIVYCRGGQTLGVGAGQMSRVVSARIAAMKAAEAGLEVKGAAMASDAFFPFRDGIDTAAETGIGVVIQPGGSMRDDEVIAAADEHGMAMIFTGMRHFRH
ncbi:MAG: bifunctional phosphoribosylaminoimidazolecarboxamide formyltransferase/IMP cyclohydrolase [Chromatiales bacterium]|nr:MAG: bifunctional phosphoribosylaminoimidazolecarboxamide formyltransferase/IMP cyclohydrolase [Chromatiales bacterium]